MARTGSHGAVILCIMAASARLAVLFFGSSDRVLASKGRGGFGENPYTLSNKRIALDAIKTGAGRCTLQLTYFFTISKSQSWRIGGWGWRMKRKKMRPSKRP